MTTSERRENSFTPEDRKLLKAVNKQVTEINGEVKRHREEIFGDEPNDTPGLKAEVKALNKLAIQLRTGIVLVVTLLSIVGVQGFLLLFRS